MPAPPSGVLTVKGSGVLDDRLDLGEQLIRREGGLPQWRMFQIVRAVGGPAPHLVPAQSVNITERMSRRAR